MVCAIRLVIIDLKIFNFSFFFKLAYNLETNKRETDILNICMNEIRSGKINLAKNKNSA